MTEQDKLERMDKYTFSTREDNIQHYNTISRKAPQWNKSYDLVVYNIGLLIRRGYAQKDIAEYFDVTESTITSLFKRTGLQRLKTMFWYAFQNNQAYLRSKDTLEIENAPLTAYDAVTAEHEQSGLRQYYADNIVQARKYDVSKAAYLLSFYYDDITRAWRYYLKVSGLEDMSYCEIFLNVNNWVGRERFVKDVLEYQLEEVKNVYEMLKDGLDKDAVIAYFEDVLDGDDDFLLSFD